MEISSFSFIYLFWLKEHQLISLHVKPTLLNADLAKYAEAQKLHRREDFSSLVVTFIYIKLKD